MSAASYRHAPDLRADTVDDDQAFASETRPDAAARQSAATYAGKSAVEGAQHSAITEADAEDASADDLPPCTADAAPHHEDAAPRIAAGAHAVSARVTVNRTINRNDTGRTSTRSESSSSLNVAGQPADVDQAAGESYVSRASAIDPAEAQRISRSHDRWPNGYLTASDTTKAHITEIGHVETEADHDLKKSPARGAVMYNGTERPEQLDFDGSTVAQHNLDESQPAQLPGTEIHEEFARTVSFEAPEATGKIAVESDAAQVGETDSPAPMPADNRQNSLLEDPLKQYYRTALNKPVLSREKHVELAKSVEAGLYAEQMLLIVEAANCGELPELAAHYQNVIHGRLVVNTPGKYEDYTDAEKGELNRQARKDTDKLIGAALRRCDLDGETGQYTLPKSLQADLEQVADEGKQDWLRLIEHNLRLPYSEVKKRGVLLEKAKDRGLEVLDVVMAANAGLIHGLEKWDYARGEAVSTYTLHWINKNILQVVEDDGRTVHLPKHVLEDILKVSKLRTDLTDQTTGEPPSDAILAEQADMPIEKIRNLRKWEQLTVSLDSDVSDGGDGSVSFGELVVDSDELLVADIVEERETSQFTREMVRMLMDSLNDSDLELISQRIGRNTPDGKPVLQKVIAEQRGYSTNTIRRHEQKIYKQLRWELIKLGFRSAI